MVTPTLPDGSTDWDEVFRQEQAEQKRAAQAACPHRHWGYDDRGNHWCSECRLWHDFPHNSVQPPVGPFQDEKDCYDRADH